MTIKFTTLAATALLVLASSASHASVIGTISHTYGSSGNSRASTGGTSCDTENATSITVTNKPSCQRFLDNFDFSAMAYTSIDSFTLTLNFSDTNTGAERWGMRPASSATAGSNTQPNLTKSPTAVSQSFTVTKASNADVFDSIVNGKNFFLWFSQNGNGQQTFTLNSAMLTVNGVAAVAAAPEPASIALLGIAALGIGAARRRKLGA